MKKWITCEELCSHWGINKYDLAEIVSCGKLRLFYAVDRSELIFWDCDSFSLMADGVHRGINPLTLSEDDVTKLIFLISDVEEYEKKNNITLQKVPAEKTSAKQSHDVLSEKKSIPKTRVAFVYNEAKKLRHDCPGLDQVMALKKINVLQTNNGDKPYSRTQFNRIVEDLKFPPARRGRKPTRSSK